MCPVPIQKVRAWSFGQSFVQELDACYVFFDPLVDPLVDPFEDSLMVDPLVEPLLDPLLALFVERLLTVDPPLREDGMQCVATHRL